MRTTTIEQQEAFLAKRKAELGLSGDTFVPVNSGRNRTDSKRAMLAELDRIARETGNRPFKANY